MSALNTQRLSSPPSPGAAFAILDGEPEGVSAANECAVWREAAQLARSMLDAWGALDDAPPRLPPQPHTHQHPRTAGAPGTCAPAKGVQDDVSGALSYDELGKAHALTREWGAAQCALLRAALCLAEAHCARHRAALGPVAGPVACAHSAQSYTLDRASEQQHRNAGKRPREGQ